MEIPTDQELYAKLLDASIRFFSFRPRSEKEFRDFLLKKLHKHKAPDEGVIDRVIARLQDLGYADDGKFVAWWVEQRQAHKPKGARMVSQELLSKGISRTLIDQQVNQGSFSSQYELARQSVAKKVLLWSKLPKLEQKKKLYGFLGRRGFDGDTIHRIIDEVVLGKVQS
ncbi:MAG: regulatory protein RecX [Patescibacteria group bacterium]